MARRGAVHALATLRDGGLIVPVRGEGFLRHGTRLIRLQEPGARQDQSGPARPDECARRQAPTASDAHIHLACPSAPRARHAEAAAEPDSSTAQLGCSARA